MAKHRTLVPVTYVKDGKAVSVAGDRTIDLDEAQAKKLAGKVVRVEEQDSMFPGGTPVIEPVIVRADVATSEVPVEPETKKPAPVAPKFSPKPVKPQNK